MVIRFRPLQEDDIPLFHQWLQRPHVHAWWSAEDGAPTLAETYAAYAPRVLVEQGVHGYLAWLGGRPIGWAQCYTALGAGEGWWPDETDPGVRGIDQFLCDADALGQGLRTRMVEAFVAMLFADPAVTRIQTDPAPGNARAIRCYEKAGFRRARSIVTPDGPAILMLRDRAAARH